MDEIIKMLDECLEYKSHKVIESTIEINVESNKRFLKCPKCSKESAKVHSRYKKSFQDLPIQGKKVTILIKNRNMFCINENCEQYTFSEKFDFIEPKAKKTKRLMDEIIRISLTQSSTSAVEYLQDTTADVKKSSVCNYLKKNERNKQK